MVSYSLGKSLETVFFFLAMFKFKKIYKGLARYVLKWDNRVFLFAYLIFLEILVVFLKLNS